MYKNSLWNQIFFFCWITEIFLRPLQSENKITIIKATEDDETVTLNVTPYHANNEPSFSNLISFKDKYIFLKGDFRYQICHTKQINHPLANLQKCTVHL